MTVLRTSFAVYTASFFATLGLTQLAACSGTVSDSNTGGEKGEDGGGSGGSASTGGSSGTGGAGAGGVSPGGSPGTGGLTGYLPCIDSTVLPGPDGEPTGYVRCEGASLHRETRQECATVLPRSNACVGLVNFDAGLPGGCTHDSDCTEHPNGSCDLNWNVNSCYCNYGCRTDEDCAADQICLCGNPVGFCTPASCGTDADCHGGLCLSYTMDPGCGGTAFACQSTADTCVNDADCAGGSLCSLSNGVHQCMPVQCAIGRPFLIEGEARLAPTACRADWSSEVKPDLASLSKGALSSLARRWTEIALMEHASVAAFARFALELLSLGAPPELVQATQAAMADETSHARDAFALASAYAGRPIGPGLLAIDGSLGSRTPLEIVRTAILEGCIGETVAAIEAREALSTATDPAVRAVLTRVTADEARHAELAWRFVQWVLREGPAELRVASARTLLDSVKAELVAADGQRTVAEPEDPAALRAHGVLDADTRREIRRRALREVILPCARALVDLADAVSDRSVSVAAWA